MESLGSDLLQSLRNPEFWAYSTWLDIATRYRRMYLGMVWMLLPPIAYIFGLGYLYSAISARGSNFLPHLGIGWSLWRLTTMLVNDASNVFTSHKAFILDGHIRLTDFLLRSMAKALFYFAFAFAVVLAVLISDPTVHWTAMLTMVVTLPLYLANLMWFAVVIALLGTRYPDVRELIQTMLLFGFFVTPILWTAQTLPSGSMRGTIARFNPAFHFVELVRAPVLGDELERASLTAVACMTVGGWLLAAWLYRRYARFVPLWA